MNCEDIVKFIKLMRIRWLRDVNNKMPKIILNIRGV